MKLLQIYHLIYEIIINLSLDQSGQVMSKNYILHNDEYLKTPSYLTNDQFYQKDSFSLINKYKYSSLITQKISIRTQINPQNNSKHFKNIKSTQNMISVVKMIGHDRLLDSLQNFTNTQHTKKSTSISQITDDRYIPSRKNLQKYYKLKENNIEDQQNQNLKDPQSISIAQIYSQQVLGSKQMETQQIQSFRNNNILRYKQKPAIRYQVGQVSQQTHTQQIIQSYLLHPTPLKHRKIAKSPIKVLDAPSLQDDFYLNLIDWSCQNHLAVGLGNCIYLWNANNSKVTKLCELGTDMVTGVGWALKDGFIGVGCGSGDVQIWDVAQQQMVRKFGTHQIRVGAVAWSTNLIATGSRDRTILLRDIRVSRDYIHKLQEHTQQICGLKWSLDQQYLASGGNDNKVAVWSTSGQLLNKFSDHKAAVKALAWSPHQHGLLATGGGTADRMIKMRNVFTGIILCQKDAGSQVCNIAFSKSLHEVVTTHGYSQHEINVWSYPNIKKKATLTGHSHRVLYLASSPDGSTIVTGAGDETLRFWNVFPSINQSSKNQSEDKFREISLR